LTLLGLEWKTERSTHVDDVTPAPAMQKYVGWESIEEGRTAMGSSRKRAFAAARARPRAVPPSA